MFDRHLIDEWANPHLSSFQSRLKHEKVHSIYNRLLAIEDIDPTLVYIQYMKFGRRAEGIKSGRIIFKKAREDMRTRHHVYVTAALMEYYCSKVGLHRLRKIVWTFGIEAMGRSHRLTDDGEPKTVDLKIAFDGQKLIIDECI